MFLGAYNNKELDKCEVLKKFNDTIIKIGDDVLNKHKFDLNVKIDVIKFLRVKHLFTIAEHLNKTGLISCCLKSTERQTLIKLSNIV